MLNKFDFQVIQKKKKKIIYFELKLQKSKDIICLIAYVLDFLTINI